MASIPPVDNPSAERRWQRFHFDVPIRLVFENGRHIRVAEGRGTELNEGGLGLYAGVELEIGDQVEVELTVPFYSLSLKLQGVVRNRPGNGYYYGIQFVDTDAAQRGEIALFAKMLETAAGNLDS
ncbi:MAG TPA: PilZ domain-containing protein [Terriglobales bacterium]|nr:PilZ domain-containing protein [Terriglobales bacterium]